MASSAPQTWIENIDEKLLWTTDSAATFDHEPLAVDHRRQVFECRVHHRRHGRSARRTPMSDQNRSFVQKASGVVGRDPAEVAALGEPAQLAAGDRVHEP